MNSHQKYIAGHIIGCLAFLALPLLLSPHPPEEINFIYSKPTLRDFIANGLMLVFFYLNYYLLIPKVYFRRKYVFYSLSIVLGFLIIAALPSLLAGHVPWKQMPLETVSMVPQSNGHWIPPKPQGSTFMQEISHHLYLFVVVTLFSVLLRVRSRLFQTEIGRHNAELSSLKRQINPHFLFNTLNNIYALAVREKSPATATSILKLSGMMRYVVTETGNGFVSLEKELSYISDYVDLQKMRLDKRVELSYSVYGVMKDQQIAPLILTPFIENAFKHGVNPDEESNINIIVTITEKELKMTIENNKVTVRIDPYMQSGKGIENTKSRLQLLYPARHFLILSEDEKHFRVQLTLQLR
jgi:hypothetical protein